jgi:hypothetical protein
LPARKIGLATDKQHGKVDMLKAARSTVAENVRRNKSGHAKTIRAAAKKTKKENK